ncbi:unnamed protein product, partial [Bubo scandiacus]
GQADRYAYERQGNHARGLHGAPPEDEGGGKQTTAPVRDLEELSLKQHLNAIHDEHLQEMKTVQQEAMKLHQCLSDIKEAEEKAKEVVQRPSTAMATTTGTKDDFIILRNTNQKINCRLQDLTEQQSQQISLQESLEESQATVMCHVQDNKLSVISLQVQILQQDCQELRKDVQLARVRLQEEEERTAHLEQQGKQLKAELGMPNAQLSFSKQHKENLQLQSKMTALRGTAEKVQVMRIDTLVFKMEIKYNKSDYSRTRKDRKLQEQDSLLNADHVKILRELQSVQHERAQLQSAL